MDTNDLKRRAGITDELNEASGKAKKWNVRVKVGGEAMWTAVYAETEDRASKIAKKLFGKNNVIGRPSK